MAGNNVPRCDICDLVSQDEPPFAIYHDDRVTVVLERESLSVGHLLIVPRTHVAHLSDLEEEEYFWLQRFGRQLAQVLRSAVQPDSIAVASASEGAAHACLYLVPISEKRETDDPQDFTRHLTNEQLELETGRLRALLPPDFATLLNRTEQERLRLLDL